MFDAVSILCSNGATVTVSGVAAIPGDNKVIENRIVGTEGYLTYCGTDEDRGKTSQGAAEADNAPAGGGELALTRFDGRNLTIPYAILGLYGIGI